MLTLIVAIGVFVSCVGYAEGRAGNGSHSGSGLALYWLGQVMILVPIVGRLLSRRPLSNGGIVTLITVLTIAEYLLKCCYSPLGFAFNDEFLHWRGTTDMLASGKLFELNYGLPIGTYYPGLEEVTSALISATGLSVFEAGLIVAGIAHLLYILFLYLAFVVAIRSHRIAGIAMLIYFSAPSLTSFNSMFIYETLGLAFLGMCIVAGLRSAIEKSPTIRRRWFIVAVLCIFATVITHHVTSYMLTAFLILVAVASAFTGSRNTAKRFGVLAAISFLSVVGWIAITWPNTWDYFSPTVVGMADSLKSLTSGGSSGATSTSASPFGNLVLEAGALLCLTVLIAIGSWQAWKRHRRHPWIIGMMIGGTIGWMISLGLRVATSDGQELAGRSATYIYIPVSVIVALALTKFVNSGMARRWGAAVTGGFVAIIVALSIDGLANGWPPYWERLPGPHQVASFESAVGPEEIAFANWTLAELGPGNVIASDQGTYPLLIAYGLQNPQQQVTVFYSDATWSPADYGAANSENMQYVETDMRLTKSLPPADNYFMDQHTAPTSTLPAANITKYNHIEGVARVYDDGTINLYSIQAQGYVAQTKP